MTDSCRNVFRLHIKPGDKNNLEMVFDYCVRSNVLGMGWPVDSSREELPWDEYVSLAETKYQRKVQPAKYFHEHVQIDDLIWTRDRGGHYYLARVTGQWVYDASKEARKVDIVNRMPCEILPVGTIDRVPGKVVASFRATRTIQAIHSLEVSKYSRHLWNKISGSKVYDAELLQDDDILTFLDDQEVEDVILVYLQKKHNYMFVPSSRRKDTMKYEFLLIHRCTGEKAVAQVKTGNTSLGDPSMKEGDEKVFLFQANSLYTIESSDKIECLDREDVLSFVQKNRSFFPDNITLWFDVFKESRLATSKMSSP